jgi:hypothetical protein
MKHEHDTFEHFLLDSNELELPCIRYHTASEGIKNLLSNVILNLLNLK